MLAPSDYSVLSNSVRTHGHLVQQMRMQMWARLRSKGDISCIAPQPGSWVWWSEWMQQIRRLNARPTADKKCFLYLSATRTTDWTECEWALRSLHRMWCGFVDESATQADSVYYINLHSFVNDCTQLLPVATPSSKKQLMPQRTDGFKPTAAQTSLPPNSPDLNPLHYIYGGQC